MTNSKKYPSPKLQNASSRTIIHAFLTKRKKRTKPSKELPLRLIPAEELAETSQAAVYRFGHSTVLIRIDGNYFLTDPVFSKRASPVQWIGPKRFQPTPNTIDELPLIKAALISHDHYDHLDKAAIKALANRVERFIIPTGLGKRLQRWGVAPSKIIERSWWQSVSLDGITLTATPSQHFTGRGLFDRDKTLASSWVIEGKQARLFYGGDSGYFPGFAEIGLHFGGFDLTMLENGAYSPFWKEIHMSPEETIQAHLDLKGRALMPIHNGTFDLAFHDWFEPMERLQALAIENGIQALTPRFGEAVYPTNPIPTTQWWREQISNTEKANPGSGLQRSNKSKFSFSCCPCKQP